MVLRHPRVGEKHRAIRATTDADQPVTGGATDIVPPPLGVSGEPFQMDVFSLEPVGPTVIQEGPYGLLERLSDQPAEPFRAGRRDVRHELLEEIAPGHVRASSPPWALFVNPARSFSPPAPT